MPELYIDEEELETLGFNPQIFSKFNADQRLAARSLGADEARWLIDTYYQVQNFRIKANNQSFAAATSGEPNALTELVKDNFKFLEQRLKVSLGAWAADDPVGQWLQSIYGIGPILSAAFLAYIPNYEVFQTSGQLLKYVGMSPNLKWVASKKVDSIYEDFDAALRIPDPTTRDWILLFKMCDEFHMRPMRVLHRAGLIAEEYSLEDGQAVLAKQGYPADMAEYFLDTLVMRAVPDETQRSFIYREITGDNVEFDWKALLRIFKLLPFNKTMKVICFRLSSGWIKFQGRVDPDDRDEKKLYVQLLRQRREQEVMRSDRGDFAEYAAKLLAEKNYSRSSESWKWLNEGKLSPYHLQLRAQRWVIKIFISHLHEVAWKEKLGKEPPVPYIFAGGQSVPQPHGKLIPVPNYPMR